MSITPVSQWYARDKIITAKGLNDSEITITR
jgi:hypothetical protein